MPLTGSEAQLKGFLLTELEKTLPNDESKPQTLKNLDATAQAIANAVVRWITTAGANAVQVNSAGAGVGSGQGANAGGPIATVVNTTVNTSGTGSLL